MPNVARVGVDLVGGAPIVGPGVTNVTVNGAPISVFGDTVTPHGQYPHNASVILASLAGNVFAGGQLVAVTGDATLCGHPVVATSTVFVG